MKLTWDLTGDTLMEYVDYLASQKLVEPTEATDRETLFSVMKDFTKEGNRSHNERGFRGTNVRVNTTIR